MPTTPQTQFHFTLTVTPAVELDSRVMDALYEAGCDDATVSVCGGVMRLAFARSALSFRDAITSAIDNVDRAKIGVTVSGVEGPALHWLDQVGGIMRDEPGFEEMVRLGQQMRHSMDSDAGDAI